MENLRNLSRWGMFAFLSVALCTSFVGCSDDDPDYSNVTPPTVSVSHSISGRVTGMDGNGLSATVSMNGESTQTGADGTFTFDDVDAGSYTLTASAPGKQSKETTVTVAESGSGANVVWNVSLPNDNIIYTFYSIIYFKKKSNYISNHIFKKTISTYIYFA